MHDETTLIEGRTNRSIKAIGLFLTIFAWFSPTLAAFSEPPEHFGPGLANRLSVGDSAALRLPDGSSLPILVQRNDSRAAGWTLSGEIQSTPPGTFVLVAEHGELAGWLNLPSAGEVLIRAERGRLRMQTRAFEPRECEASELDPRVMREAAPWMKSALTLGPGAQTQANAGSLDELTPSAPCPCDDGETIDLLVLHTDAARTNPNSAGVSLDAFLQLAVGSANQAFLSSGVDTSLRIVGQEQVGYLEGTGTQAFLHLQRLTFPGDGFLDEVPALREEVGADLVTLFVYLPGAGGNAWGPNGPEWGFSAMSTTSSVATFTHEVGHNLGAGHDPATIINSGGNPQEMGLSYAFGHKFDVLGNTYITIMSYTSAGEQYVHAYSNPEKQFMGVPTGLAPGAPQAACNAYAMEFFRRKVSSYLDDGFADCNDNGVDDATEIIQQRVEDANHDGVPDNCQGRLYVDHTSSGGDGSSWARAWPDLKDALYSASQPCSSVRELWAAEGTYRPDRNQGARWMAFEFGSGAVELYGGFDGTETHLDQRDWIAHPTVLSGDLALNDLPGFQNRADNSRQVVTMPILQSKRPLMDGFTIRGGNAHDAQNFRGAGLSIYRGAPTLRNIRFEDNSAYQGGGFYVFLSPAKVRMQDCMFANNRSTFRGGALSAGSSSIVVDRTQFVGNASGTGGAMELSSSDVGFRDCVFLDNQAAQDGGALYTEYSNVRALRSRLLGSEAGNRGGSWYTKDSDVVLSNALISGTTAGLEGGALYAVQDGAVSWINCTVLDSIPNAVALASAPLSIANSILWRNGAIPIDATGSGLASISYSAVEGGASGPGNTAVEPTLVNSLGPDGLPGTGDEDVALLPGSPAGIDAGSWIPVLSETTVDLEHMPRFVDDPATPDTGLGSAPVVDMGAREFQP